MDKKSVLVVGNGHSLLGSELGQKIDEFDEVIRINDWKTKGFEKDVGTKADIWIVYDPLKSVVPFITGYQKIGYSIEEIKSVANQIKEIWYVCWKIENLISKWADNQSIKDLGIYDRCKRHLSVPYSKRIQRDLPIPGTGFSTLWVLTHMYDKVYITGFDFADVRVKSEYAHYFGTKKVNKRETDIHNRDVEYAYVENNWIKTKKVEYLNKDTTIQKANYISTEPEVIECKVCKKMNYVYNWEMPICHYCEG